MCGSHCLKTWSKTQAMVALSSAESELYGLIKAIADGLGPQSILKDLEVKCKVMIKGDASAALGIIGRRGLEKFRRIDTSHLLAQAALVAEIPSSALRRFRRFMRVVWRQCLAQRATTSQIRCVCAACCCRALVSRRP